MLNILRYFFFTLKVHESIKSIDLAFTLGLHDVRQRYRRSVIGPFWLTISMGILIATLGFVFGTVFGSPMSEFLPFLAVGLIFWTFISTVLIESCSCFQVSSSIILQIPLDFEVHVLRVLFRNLIILCHNILIIPLLFFFLSKSVGVSISLVIFGLILNIIFLYLVALLLSIICAKFRDFAQIISSALQIFFYITPIIWSPALIADNAERFFFININPFYHFIEVVRGPILGAETSNSNWILAFFICCFLSIFAPRFFKRYTARIAFWL